MPRYLRALLSALAVTAAVLQDPAVPLAQTAEQVTFRLIVVSTAAAAQDVAAQLAAGSDFAALARARSIDPSSERSGLIGPVELPLLREELRDALTVLAPGQVSAIIRVPTGFAVVQRLEAGAVVAAGRTIGSSEIAAVAATGGVRYTVSVDGFSEANTALDGVAKPERWNEDPRLICELRKESLARVKNSLSTLLGPAAAARRSEFTPQEIVEAYVALANLHAYEGEMQRVLEEYQRAYALAESTLPEALPDLTEMLGVAHLHKAHVDSGVFHAPGDRCLLTDRAPAPLTDRADADKAVEHFLRYLQGRPGDLEVKWLLNLAYMASGGYPAQVPAAHLVPPASFASGDAVGRFTDIAAASGVDAFSSAGGVVVDDFDNDGQLEILTSNFDSCGAMKLFARGADGRFTDRAAAAGLGDQLGGLNLVQADYDNDGCRAGRARRGSRRCRSRPGPG